ncbi:MAG: Abi family protein [Clostridia bacterium]|nr:Abi family protein [Clostridia bacterium]
MSAQKQKLNVLQQVEHMKSKGIRFNIEDEKYATEYLSNNTYYFKLKAYEKLYNKSPTGENAGKYINLEFAYLRDLATIDSLLRKKILSIAIDIEHYLKVKLLNDFNLSHEDGYEIIKAFKEMDPNHFEKDIANKLNGRLCSSLVAKYKDDFAIWNFIEIIGFNDFRTLYELFYIRNSEMFCNKKDNTNFKGEYYYLINPVRLLRNAAAHNNCLLIGLSPSLNLPLNYNGNVQSFLGKNGIKNTSLNRQMSKPIIHDFCVMLYLYSLIAPEKAQIHTFEEFKELFENRVFRNINYYKSNSLIESSLEFMYKVVCVFEKNVKKN